MEQQLLIYNTLSRQKELFRPLTEGRVGMYVCGPTVYGDGHLGHARPAITFDVVFRYLSHLGYKVLARTLLFCQCQIMQLLIKKYKNYGKDYWN